MWRAALDDAEVAVPADAVDAFRARFAPRLAELRGVTSSDGSFAPPQIGPPVLVLRAVFSGEHALSLVWEWSYDVDGTDTRVGLDRPASRERFRDLDAEDAVLDALDDLPVDWERFRVHPTDHHGPHRLIGLHTAAFVTEVFPVLDDADGVRVERSGTLTDYREVGDDVAIEVSTTETATGNDWFDLGVSVVAEGREVPFTEVFKALATGQTHLLLPDGAFFSLEKPEFVALRRLIDEARAMQDRPAGAPLRVSPYQADWWEELAALGVVTHQAEAWRERVDGLLASRGALEPAPVPTSLRADLRPYQRAGFEWLAFLWRHGLGGVLADDMGLGKTVQALALIAHARETDPGAGPVLIVAPTSVVANWTAEAARFTPGAARGGADRHAAAARAGDRGRRRRGRRGRHLVHALPPRRGRPRADRLVGGPVRRGPVPQEPPLEGVLVRPTPRRAVQAGDHRDADGERPDGALGAALDHRSRALPQPGDLPAGLREEDREGRRRGPGAASAAGSAR